MRRRESPRRPLRRPAPCAIALQAAGAPAFVGPRLRPHTLLTVTERA